MKASSVVGWAVGVAMLLSSFFLPFWNLTSGSSAPFDTLYGAGRFVVYDLSIILQSGQGAASSLAFLVLAAALLVGVSGLLGVFPRASGVLGALGMLLLTMGPVIFDADFVFTTSNYGTGYWAIWLLSLVNVFVGVTMGGKSQPIPPPGAQAPPQPAPAPAPSPSPAPAPVPG